MLPVLYGLQKVEPIKKIGQSSHMLFLVLVRCVCVWYVIKS